MSSRHRADDLESDENEFGLVCKQVSRSQRAGLQFAIERLVRYLKEGGYASRVGGAASVYMAAVVEYIVAVALELAGDAVRNYTHMRIIPHCIRWPFYFCSIICFIFFIACARINVGWLRSR